MKYVFDTNSFMELFEHFYESRFPTLWQYFNELISESRIISVREVFNEINSHQKESRLVEWSKINSQLFEQPTDDEIKYIQYIFQQPRFQMIVEKKKILTGKPVADPFIVVKAKVMNGIVVTQERYKENGAKVPNVCEFLEVPYTDLEGFMEREKWKF